MPRYAYIAKTKEGKTVRQTEEALSKEEMLGQLRARGFFVISLEETKEEKRPSFSFFRRGKRYRVKLYDLVRFSRDLCVTLSSGLTLLRSLEIIASETESIKLEKALRECIKNIKDGLSLSEALTKHPDIFSSLWRAITEVGETSGNLPFVMEKLADYLEVRLETERKVKSALIYPTIILFAAAGALFIFLTFILPKFVVIFEQFKLELPLITKIVVSSSKIFQKYILLILILIAAGIYFLSYSFKSPSVRKIWDRVLLRVPILGELIFMGCLERFTSSVSILLDSGLPLVSTLGISAYAMNNSFLEKAVLYMQDRVKEGGSLSLEFAKQGLFPLLISEMAKIGEETGTLPEIFGRVSLHYRREFSTRVERLINALGPLIILFLGVVIGFIVISLFLPIFRLSTLGGGQGLGV